MRNARLTLLVLTLGLASLAHADAFTPLVKEPIVDAKQAAEAIRAYYTKYDYRIPMRDGVKLYAVAYVPKADGPWPVLMERTPYSVAPYGVDNLPVVDAGELGCPAPSYEAIRAGYIFVGEDVRGRLMSEGQFVDIRPELDAGHAKNAISESTDTWDTIEFLVHHLPRNNGRVGVYGRS